MMENGRCVHCGAEIADTHLAHNGKLFCGYSCWDDYYNAMAAAFERDEGTNGR